MGVKQHSNIGMTESHEHDGEHRRRHGLSGVIVSTNITLNTIKAEWLTGSINEAHQ